MPRITPGNRLYLYQLFVREIGVGKQTMLARMEEVLLQDDIWPSDLECADARELLEQLEDFVRLTVFKKGRVYATVLARPEWDQLLAQEEDKGTDTKPTGKAGPKSWKRKRSPKTVRPAKPRPKGRPEPEPKVITEPEPMVEPEPEPAANPEPVPEPTAEANPTVEPEQEVVAEPMPKPDSEPVADAKPEPEPIIVTAAESEPEPEPAANPEPAPEPPTEPAPEPTPEAEQVAEPSISITVTYDPYEGLEEFISPQQAPSPAPQPSSADSAQPDPPLVPHRFASEVLCADEELSVLYQVLPLDIDPVSILDEDWRVARSTNNYTNSHGVVTFPLRYLRARKDQHVQISMHRITRTTSNKRWKLMDVDAGDINEVGFEGLPSADDGVWYELLGSNERMYATISPARSFAQFVALGPWQDLLSELASLAAPEHWGTDYEVLREYLTLTFYRVRMENKIAPDQDGDGASFDTGLFTSRGERILMRLCSQEDDIPWAFGGFCVATSQEAPEPASYVRALEDITLAPPFTTYAEPRLERTYGHALQPAMDTAIMRAQRDYRLATPAYDPQTNSLRLLLPLALEQESTRASHALVLVPHGTEGYAATAVLTLERAYICARIVSVELPRWLCADYSLPVQQ